MKQTVRNRYRNRFGLGMVTTILAWILVLAVVWGTYVMVKQRMESTRQRIVSMEEEMGRIAHQIESIHVQQGALLNRESLRHRLETGGSALIPISLDKVRRIDPSLAAEQGMAMGPVSNNNPR